MKNNFGKANMIHLGLVPETYRLVFEVRSNSLTLDEGVDVSLTLGQNTITNSTNVNGIVAFKELNIGTYTISVDGYNTVSPIAVENKKKNKFIIVNVKNQYDISLTIKNNESPVATGTEVSIFIDEEDPVVEVTDEDGLVVFENLDPDTYNILVDGYNTIDIESIELIDENIESDINVSNEYDLTLNITNNEEPITEGTSVAIQLGENDPITQLSNGTGSVVFADILEGEYIISVDGFTIINPESVNLNADQTVNVTVANE